MLISPITPAETNAIVEEAYDDLCKSKNSKDSYKKLSPREREKIQQLCWFFAFYICEKLSEKIEPEVNALVEAVRKTADLPEIKEIDRDLLQEALVNLRQLKGGGLTPGNRIPTRTVDQHVFKGSAVFCKKAPTERFMVDSWSPDFKRIIITNGLIQGEFDIQDLVFIGNIKSHQKETAQPEIGQAQG